MGNAHLIGLTRHGGKPTSGRYVYRPRTSDMQRLADVWYWQCDLHDGPEALPDQYGEGATMQDAFAGALDHAVHCHESRTVPHGHRTRESRDACTHGLCDPCSLVHEPKGRECIEPGCVEFPDATWDRCTPHQDAHEHTNRSQGDER